MITLAKTHSCWPFEHREMLLSIYLYLIVFSVDSKLVHDKRSIDHLVHTDKGDVRGRMITKNGYQYIAYLGIPFAASMTGSKRYQAPLPAHPWKILSYEDKTVSCLPGTIGATEDCLILSVFTPTKDKSHGLLPVIFIVHWTQRYKPPEAVGSITDQGVIVVTSSYREGPLGFLCLRIKEVPGNAALKDTVAALKWVQKNIARFGGDPKKVTLHGCSIGATYAHILVISPITRGLFRNVILEGGSALNYWGMDLDPYTVAQDVAIKKTLRHENFRKLLDFYRRYPFDKFTNATFKPCVEKKIRGIEAIITDHPSEILLNHRYKSIPIMIIFSTIEALNFEGDKLESESERRKMDLYFETYFPSDLMFRNQIVKKILGDKVRHAYIGNNKGKKAIKGYLDFLGDAIVLYRVLESARLHAETNHVYLMEFAYRGQFGHDISLGKRFPKAVHADFVNYFLNTDKPKTKDEEAIVNKSVSLVANFVKYSNPTPKGNNGFVWPHLSPGQPMKYLHFDRKITILSDPYTTRMQIWKDIYDKHGMKLQKNGAKRSRSTRRRLGHSSKPPTAATDGILNQQGATQL